MCVFRTFNDNINGGRCQDGGEKKREREALPQNLSFWVPAMYAIPFLKAFAEVGVRGRRCFLPKAPPPPQVFFKRCLSQQIRLFRSFWATRGAFLWNLRNIVIKNRNISVDFPLFSCYNQGGDTLHISNFKERISRYDGF